MPYDRMRVLNFWLGTVFGVSTTLAWLSVGGYIHRAPPLPIHETRQDAPMDALLPTPESKVDAFTNFTLTAPGTMLTGAINPLHTLSSEDTKTVSAEVEELRRVNTWLQAQQLLLMHIQQTLALQVRDRQQAKEDHHGDPQGATPQERARPEYPD